MRLAIIGVGALVALGGCDLSIDTEDGHFSAHLGVRWETPERLDQVEVIGDAAVEIRVDPWLTHGTATAHGVGGTLDGMILRTAAGRLSVIGDTEPGVVIVIEVPALERAALVGDGRVDVFDADAETLELALAGAGVVTADGRVHRVRVNASGDGRVDASALRAGVGSVALYGSAVAIVCASGGLDATVAQDAVLIRRCE